MCGHEPCHRRRRLLAAALALPAAGLVGPGAVAAVRHAEGGFRINGKPADTGRELAAGDRIATAVGSQLLLAVPGAALLVGSATELEFGREQDGGITGLLRLVSGALQAAFEPGAHRVRTAQATAGIRGTGIYASAAYGETYLCTCYGTVDIDADGQQESVHAVHHAARTIADGTIRPDEMRDHEDAQVRRVAAAIGQRAFPDWDG